MAIERTGPLPEAVNRALKWLAIDRKEDDYRDYQYQQLVNAYDGWLFDLDRSTPYGTRMSTDLLDVSDPTQSDDRFHEISANLAFPLVEDWKSIIGIQPSVYVPSSSPGDPTSDAQANLRERILGGIDSDSGMEIKSLEGGHYQSLLGSQVQYLVPDYNDRRIRKRVVSPYKAHARLYLDGINLHHLAFDIESDKDMILEDYPDLERLLDKDRKTAKVSEWMDRKCRIMLVDDMWVEGMPYVEHNWGFVPGVIIPNIVGTGSLWSRSDIRQVIHLSQILSEVVSMQHDALFQNVHDQILAFADKPITQLAVGPYEITQFEKDAKVQLLHQGANLPDVSSSQATLERLARLIGGWPLVMSSEMDSSVISGKAYNAAQGPVGARAAIKHMVMAAYQQRLNSMALHLYEREFGNEEIVIPLVMGGFHTSLFPSGARQAVDSTVKFTPNRDIAGQYANFLTFPATGSEAYRDSIKWLQYAEAGIVSVAFIRENTPGIDPEAEEKRVAREFLEKAQRSAQAMAMQQQQMAPPPGAGAAGPAPQAAAPQGPPQAPTEPQGPEGPVAPPQQGAPMNPEEMEGPPTAAPAAPQGQAIRLSDAKKVFAAVSPIRGIILIGGALAATGTTTGSITVYISDPQDKGTLISQTPYGRQGRLLFHKLVVDANGNPKPPDEQTVNVTPRQAVEVR